MTSDPEDRKIVTVEQLTHYIFNEGPIVPFDDLEPAPSKDWRPACFNHTPDGCDQVRFATIEECSECPYRKVKE